MVGLVSSISLCSIEWITSPYFGDVSGSCISGCSRLVTSPILSFRRSCTDGWCLSLDVAFPLLLLLFPGASSCKWVVWEVLSKGELLPHEVSLSGYY